MANHARAALESALRARRLDRTLTTALPARPDPGTEPAVPVGVTTLDAALGGGLPRGQLSIIAGPRSSGRTSLLLQVMAAATRRGEWAALVDTFDHADPASVARAGIVPERFLWVRGAAIVEAPPVARGAAEAAVLRAIKAWHLVLRAGGFGIAALDLSDVPPAALARIRFTTWLRVHRVLEDADTAGVLLASRTVGRSPGGLALVLDGTSRWTGAAGLGRRLTGLHVRVRARSPRRGEAVETTFEIAARGL